jgi:hypothetical protein
MAQRIAGSLALLVFAISLCAGLNAENPFSTVITRAILGMLLTLVIGLVVGAMAQKMLDENLQIDEKNVKKGSLHSSEDGR